MNYCESSDKSNLKAIIISKVVLGRVFYPKDADSHFFEFDTKFHDSIYGTPNITINLSQPEICIFN
jgi:hypothetical protein